MTRKGQSPDIVRITKKGSCSEFIYFGQIRFAIRRPSLICPEAMPLPRERIRRGIIRIEADRLLEHPPRLLERVAIEPVDQIETAQPVIVSIKAFGALAADP